MKPLNLNFPQAETQFEQWHAEKLPIGIDLLCFKKSRSILDFVLPVFEKEGLVLTFLNHSGDLQVGREKEPGHLIAVSAGTGILTASSDPLTLKSSGPADVSVIMISIPGKWIDHLMKDNDPFLKIAGALREGMVTAKLSRKQIPLLSELIETKRRENNDGRGPQSQILSLIELFLCHCHRNFSTDELSTVIDNQEDISLVRQVESYISEYYCSDTFTVDTILKKTYTSYHKLNFLFKSIHGMTISEYIRNKRIERSKEMIVDNVKSISQIAYEIGYSSISNYILAFKKIYRITPGKYKKQIGNVA